MPKNLVIAKDCSTKDHQAAAAASKPDLTISEIAFGPDRMPIYPSLINDQIINNGVQIEPGVQIAPDTTRALTFVLELELESDVTYVVEEGQVKVEAVLGTLPTQLISADPSADRKRCTIVWKPEPWQPGDRPANALRIFCTNPDGDELTLLFAFIKTPDRQDSNPPTRPDPRLAPQIDIEVYEIDDLGRPLFDLFTDSAYAQLPEELELEPTFRVAPEQEICFRILLARSLLIRFKPPTSGPSTDQVGVLLPIPAERQAQLLPTVEEDDYRICKLTWSRQDVLVNPPGGVGNFALSVGLNDLDPSQPGVSSRSAILLREIDPTIIDDPPLTGG